MALPTFGGNGGGGGGGGTVTTAAPVSGTGTALSPVTIADAALTLAKLPAAGAASILMATGAGAHTDGTGAQALAVIINGTTQVIKVTGSAVQDVTFSGLAGDTDGNYLCDIYAPSGFGGSGYVLNLQPNADATLASVTGYYQSHADGVVHGQNVGNLVVGTGGSTAYAGSFYFASNSGRGNRPFRSEFNDTEGGTDYRYNFFGWYTGAAAITSLKIHHANAAGIPVGTVFVLRALGEL